MRKLFLLFSAEWREEEEEKRGEYNWSVYWGRGLFLGVFKWVGLDRVKEDQCS